MSEQGHHHGDGLGKEVKLIQDEEAMQTEPCELQEAMHIDTIGRIFLTSFEHLCQKGTEPDFVDILFEEPNFDAEMVNDGAYDHKYAVSILKHMKNKNEKNLYKLYELVKKHIFKNDELVNTTFKFSKKHNAFQEMRHQINNIDDIFEFKIGKMVNQNFNYNSPRLSKNFGQNLIIGSRFDNESNIRIQRWSNKIGISGVGFYFYIGDDNTIEKKFFVDCVYDHNQKKFKMTKLTLQVFIGWGFGGYTPFTSGSELTDFTIEKLIKNYPEKKFI